MKPRSASDADRARAGSRDLDAARRWIAEDARLDTFRNAIYFVNYERVPGDILEFGVGNGKSMALFSLLSEQAAEVWRDSDPVIAARRVVGFDSFIGLPKHREEHPRWRAGEFCHNYEADHPLLGPTTQISAADVGRLFAAAGLAEPRLECGWFGQTVPATVPGTYSAAAIVHLDCDLYESARDALFGVEPALRNGTILLLDDYFCYRGDPDRGEAKALREFQAAFPHWRLVHYRSYSVFCNAFILHDARAG